MQNQLGIWAGTLIWLFWLGIAVLAALAAHAFTVELREGFTLSKYRLITLGAIMLAGTLFAVSMTLFRPEVQAVAHRESGVSTVLPQNQAQVDAAETQLSQISDQLKQLDKDQRTLQDRRKEILASRTSAKKSLDSLGVKTPITAKVADTVQEIDGPGRVQFGLGGMALLLVAGILAMALGGRLETLFPFAGLGREDAAKLRARVDELAFLVNSAKYREALQVARTIPERGLRPLDALDLLFLRAFSEILLVAFPVTEDSAEQRTQYLADAIADLELVTSEAPKREEAIYALGIAYGLQKRHKEALQSFETAGPRLDPKAMKEVLEHNQGICCLRLAEESLGRGNTSEAEQFYARASKLGQQTDLVIQSRIRIAMIDLRSGLARGDLGAACAALVRIEALPNLGAKEGTQLAGIGSALNAQLALRRDDPQAAVRECDAFLGTNLPTDLPELGNNTADEPFSPVLDEDLPFPRPIYQSFLFIRAVSLSRLESARQTRLSPAQVDRLADPLLRALQLVPRQRDLLGALGGLYCWFRREDAGRAREWLEAAISMGAKGRLIRSILECDLRIEQERGTALEWFRSASARFLRDSTITADARRVLVEELGRFQEFAPMLIELQDKPQLEEEEPTVQGLRDRSTYLADLLANVVVTGPPERYARLVRIQEQYNSCLNALDQNAQTISALERQVFAELADTLVMR